jgi:hypothetical protein
MAEAVTAPSAAHEVIAKDFLTKRKLLFYRPYLSAATLTPKEVANHHNFGRLIRVMEEMARFAQANDLEVAVISVPTKEEVYSWVLDDGEPWTSDPQPSALGAALREQCDRLGLGFLDLKPALISESRRVFEESQELLWWYDDTHWNERGHEVASAIVYQGLIQPFMARRDKDKSEHKMAVTVSGPCGE